MICWRRMMLVFFQPRKAASALATAAASSSSVDSGTRVTVLLVAGSATLIHLVAAEGVNLLLMKLCVGSGFVILECVVGHGRMAAEWLARDRTA